MANAAGWHLHRTASVGSCVGGCHTNRCVHVCIGPVVVAIVKNEGLISHGQWRRVRYLPGAAAAAY